MQSKLRIWRFDFAKDSLTNLTRWSTKNDLSDKLMVTFRLSNIGSENSPDVQLSYERFMERFEHSIVAELQVTAWPGTQLSCGAARVLVLKFAEGVAEEINNMESSLGSWLHPNLPEDLCIFSDGAEAPLFMSVTHERLGWVISETVPPVSNKAAVGEYSEEMREYLIVSREDYFVSRR